MTPPWTHTHNHSNSPDPSDSENTPQLGTDTSQAKLLKVTAQFLTLCVVQLISCDHISEFAWQYQVDKNTAQAEVNHLTRKLADITNDNDGNNSSTHAQAKRQRVHHDSPSADTDDKDMDTGTHASEQFVYQARHKFFLLCALWIHSGDNLFDLDVDEDYDAADRFKDDQNKDQGQLREIVDLLQEKFQVHSLSKRWLRWQVSYIHIFEHCTYSLHNSLWMASIRNDIILQTGFITAAPWFWVPVRVTSSNQTSGWPNFVRRLDGWVRLGCTQALMFQSFIRIGMVSTPFLLPFSTQSLWVWVPFFIPTFWRTELLHRFMSPSFMVLRLESISWIARLFIPKLKWWPESIISATLHQVPLLHVLYLYVIAISVGALL